MQSGFFSLEKGGAMQQPSPTQSSPSTGFMGGPRSSPLFSSAVDQPEPPPPTGQDVGRCLFSHYELLMGCHRSLARSLSLDISCFRH